MTASLRLLASGSLAATLGMLVSCSGTSTTAASHARAMDMPASSPSSSGPIPAAAAGSADRPGVDAASRVESGQRLVVTVGGEDIGIKNGATVRLGEGVTAELFMDPFPPRTLSAVLDVYLKRNDCPVEDGFVSVAYDMLAMDHGPFGATAKGIGGGHFLVPLDYIMFGTWDQTLTIRAGTVRTELRIVVIARP